MCPKHIDRKISFALKKQSVASSWPFISHDGKCYEFQKGTSFSSPPQIVSIDSGVLSASYSIGTGVGGGGVLFPRKGCQTLQLQPSTAEAINDRSRTATYLYALMACQRIDLRNSLCFYSRFPFFPSSFISFFVLRPFFPSIIPSFFFWTTQSAECLDYSLKNQISEVRSPERVKYFSLPYKTQTILQVSKRYRSVLRWGFKLPGCEGVPPPSHAAAAIDTPPHAAAAIDTPPHPAAAIDTHPHTAAAIDTPPHAASYRHTSTPCCSYRHTSTHCCSYRHTSTRC